MNTTTARCGHAVPAVGEPNSSARRAQEARHCGRPRCESGLPAKFTDRECAAYVWLWHRGVTGWVVDFGVKTVVTVVATAVQPGFHEALPWPNLIEFAHHHGWDG